MPCLRLPDTQQGKPQSRSRILVCAGSQLAPPAEELLRAGSPCLGAACTPSTLPADPWKGAGFSPYQGTFVFFFPLAVPGPQPQTEPHCTVLCQLGGWLYLWVASQPPCSQTEGFGEGSWAPGEHTAPQQPLQDAQSSPVGVGASCQGQNAAARGTCRVPLPCPGEHSLGTRGLGQPGKERGSGVAR